MPATPSPRRARAVLPTAAAAVLVVPLAVAAPAAAAPLPEPRDVVRVDVLDRSAGYVRDVDGVAHVQAGSPRDALAVQGWLHAQDRLFQMDTLRRQPSGTLAELVGPSALPGDVQARTLGLRRAAEASLPLLEPRTRQWLQAYADGVNAWVERNGVPEAYAALEVDTFEPWTPVDSVVVSKAIAFNLSFDLDTDLTEDFRQTVAAGQAAGLDGQALFSQDLFAPVPFGDAVTVADALGTPPPALPPYVETPTASSTTSAARSAAGAALVERWQEQVEDLPMFAAALDDEHAQGSNEWAVSGSLTTTGRPVMANDPHLGLDMPAIFYPVQLFAPGLDVIGESFAGVPGVVLGQNRHLAWGATTTGFDVTDTFLERVEPDASSPSGLVTVHDDGRTPLVPIPETYRVNPVGDGQVDPLQVVPSGDDVPAATLVSERRGGGPVVQLDAEAGTALTVQYTGFVGTRELEAFFGLAEARTLDDVQRALLRFDVGSQNFSVVTRTGDIGYFTTGEVPLREDLQAGFVDGAPPWLVRDGTGGNDWLLEEDPEPFQAVPYQVLPPDELPAVVNPPEGFFVNANNDPVGTTLDGDPLDDLRPDGGIFYLNFAYDGFRATRITEVLRDLFADGPVTPEQVQEVQDDVVLLDATVLTPYLVAALERATTSSTPELAALAADPRVVEAVGRLAAWDGSTPTGIDEGYDASDEPGGPLGPEPGEVEASVAATLYSVWRGQALRGVVDAPVEAIGAATPPGQLALSLLRRLLEDFETDRGVGASGLEFFAVDGVADAADARDVLLLRAMADTLDLLAGEAFAPAFGGSTDQDDYRWGLLHRVVLDHPLDGPFDAPPAGGAFPPPLPDLPGIPTDGGYSTVDVANHDPRAAAADEFMFGSGPARRYFGEAVRGGVDGQSSLPGGTSGRLGDPHYVDLLRPWLTNEEYPFRTTRAEVYGAAERTVVLVAG